MDFLKDLNLDKIRNAAEDVINQAKPKTEVEARVYEVLSHKNWGSSSTVLNEVSRDTYDYDKFPVVTRIMWESLENQRPAAWRVVFKGLTLLEHLVKNGSERCVDDARNHSHTLRSLFSFNYYEGTVDRGVGVREKSKQLVEILGDDERIREERTKAKQLREKFGGNLSGVSSSGGGGGGRYEGYGNDDKVWATGNSGGYGGGGIGSSSSTVRAGGSGGGFADSTTDRGYSGRYSDGGTPSNSAAVIPTATFASLPEKKEKKEKKPTKVKKVKKKKEASPSLEPAPAAAAGPEIDLFSLDTPAAETGHDSFDAFQSAPAVQTIATHSEFDAFGDFSSAPVSAQNQQNYQFDAFGPGPSNYQTSDTSGGLLRANVIGGDANMNNMTSMFSDMGMSQQQVQQQQMNLMNGSSMLDMQQTGRRANSMGGRGSVVSQPQTQLQSADEDDFGDFEDASPSKAKKVSSDPLSKLISLDGLAKNQKKDDKSNEPIVYNQAAAQYVQNKHVGSMENISSKLAFSGVDGLNSIPTDFSPKGGMQRNNRPSGQPVMVSGTRSFGNSMTMGMGQQGGKDAISGFFAPQTPQQGGMGILYPQQLRMMGSMGGQQQGSIGIEGLQGGSLGQQGSMNMQPGGMGIGSMNQQSQSMGMRGQQQGSTGTDGIGLGGMGHYQDYNMNSGLNVGMGGQQLGGMGMGGQQQGGMNMRMGGQQQGGMSLGMGGQQQVGMGMGSGLGGQQQVGIGSGIGMGGQQHVGMGSVTGMGGQQQGGMGMGGQQQGGMGMGGQQQMMGGQPMGGWQ